MNNYRILSQNSQESSERLCYKENRESFSKMEKFTIFLEKIRETWKNIQLRKNKIERIVPEVCDFCVETRLFFVKKMVVLRVFSAEREKEKLTKEKNGGIICHKFIRA